MNAKKNGFMKAHLPFVIATLGEFIALYFWLVYYKQESYVVATGILFAGFLAERLAVLYWVKVNFGGDIGIAADSKPWHEKLRGLALICISEIFVWMVFFYAFMNYGIWAAFVVLFIGEQIEHSVELGLLAQRKWTSFLFTWSATMITVLETAGGVAWLYLDSQGQPQLGGAMMLLGLTIEHVVQGNAIKKKLQSEESTDENADPASAGESASESAV